MRQCGDCTLCCKILGVAELNKKAREYCPHCEINQGCKIYQTRPKECSDFQCLWLLGEIPEDLKPNKTGVMLTDLKIELKIQGYEAFNDFILVYPETMGDQKKGAMKNFLNDLLAHGTELILVDGEKKIFMKWGKVEDDNPK